MQHSGFGSGEFLCNFLGQHLFRAANAGADVEEVPQLIFVKTMHTAELHGASAESLLHLRKGLIHGILHVLHVLVHQLHGFFAGELFYLVLGHFFTVDEDAGAAFDGGLLCGLLSIEGRGGQSGGQCGDDVEFFHNAYLVIV